MSINTCFYFRNPKNGCITDQKISYSSSSDGCDSTYDRATKNIRSSYFVFCFINISSSNCCSVFWVSEVEYILLCLATTGITFFTWNELEKQKIIEEDGSLLWWTDTIGVGAFCVIGTQNEIRKGLNPIICILCGMFTATFGGVIRDVLCQRKPRILHSNAEIYATTALTGVGYMYSRNILV